MDPTLSAAQGGPVSSAVVDQLARTKGWTRFFSILLWIAAILMILAGMAMFAIGAFGGTMSGDLSGPLAGLGMGIAMGGVYIALAVIYIYPALKLGNYSSRIADLMATPNEANLVAALDQQRAFWKYVGIWMIIIIALYVAAFALGLAVLVMGGLAAA